jgi:hypothetical protein
MKKQATAPGQQAAAAMSAAPAPQPVVMTRLTASLQMLHAKEAVPTASLAWFSIRDTTVSGSLIFWNVGSRPSVDVEEAALVVGKLLTSLVFQRRPYRMPPALVDSLTLLFTCLPLCSARHMPITFCSGLLRFD